MSFKTDDDKLLKKYKKIWEKVEFDSGPVYGDNDKYIKTKIKMHEDRLNTSILR